MSDNKQTGPGKIIRTSSGSTRLTAGSSKTDSSSGSSGSAGAGNRSGDPSPPPPEDGHDVHSRLGEGIADRRQVDRRRPSCPEGLTEARTGPLHGLRSCHGRGVDRLGGDLSGRPGHRQRSGHLGDGQRREHGPGELRGREDGREEHGRQREGKKKKGPRTVRLTVAAVDPWSVMKMSFLMSVAIGIATIVAFVVLWVVLQATGVMSGLEATMTELAGAESAERLIGIFGFGRVVAAGFIIAIINIVLMTALSTLVAFIYNIGSLIAGGFHLTLTDD
ncbi:DUF3566 domain-containing protein [Brevibacterium casei]|nr:DUF3566 domain-containing protein [Brevibacterium casei]